jgi:hypothetical protein
MEPILTREKNIFFIIIFSVIAVFFNFGCHQRDNKDATTTSTSSTEPVNVQQQKAAIKSMLIGDWIRTDAPYQITISELNDDGRMKAAYFNPQSINVGSALWTSANGVFKVYIELRDENYPGSNYNLYYYPEKDILAGKYFQAVESLTYEVGFLRKK